MACNSGKISQGTLRYLFTRLYDFRTRFFHFHEEQRAWCCFIINFFFSKYDIREKYAILKYKYIFKKQLCNIIVVPICVNFSACTPDCVIREQYNNFFDI